MLRLNYNSTYSWALTGIFAAFHIITSIIPFSVLGMGGGFLTWGMVSAPLIGFLLGPIFGAISVLIGSFLVAGFINIGGVLGPIVPVVAPVCGALVAGSLRDGRPEIPLVVIIISIVAYLLSPIGLLSMIFVWFHIIGVVAVLSFFVPKVKEGLASLQELDTFKGGFILWVLCLIAVLADHIAGTAVSSYYFVYVLAWDANGLAIIYNEIALVYPLERLLAATITTFVVLVTFKALEKSGLTQRLGKFEELEEKD